MANTLVEPADLLPFPGAPFTQEVVDAAVAAVRKTAGWHIAPSVTETATVESQGGRFLFLRTLHLTEVTAVRDVTNSTPVVLDGYRTHQTDEFKAGILDRPCGWPCGVLEVDLTHGYPECPEDLLPAVAELCRAAKSARELVTVSADGVSRTSSGRESHGTSAAVAGYTIFTV